MISFSGYYPIDEGFGRTDAIARISNKVFGDELDPANYVKGSGPVSYPAIWDAPKFDWVQYTGSVSQPLARNLSESLGVGATVELIDAYKRPVPQSRRFSSDSLIENLVKIEETVEQLRPPRWPDQILGSVDMVKAEAGRKLFTQHCAHCHETCLETPFQNAVTMPQRPSDHPLWRTTLIPIEEVGTDPQTSLNFYDNRINLEKTGITARKRLAACLARIYANANSVRSTFKICVRGFRAVVRGKSIQPPDRGEFSQSRRY